MARESAIDLGNEAGGTDQSHNYSPRAIYDRAKPQLVAGA
jgi:hypothetical protein